MLYAFLIWLVMALCFVGLGIYNFLSKQKSAFGFWANAKVFDVADVKAYNRALGKLWCTFGVVFALLGLPLIWAEFPIRSAYHFGSYAGGNRRDGGLCDCDRKKIPQKIVRRMRKYLSVLPDGSIMRLSKEAL